MSVTNGRKVQTSRKPTELDREHKAAREAVARAERQYVVLPAIVLRHRTGFSAEAVATQLEAAERRLKQAEKTVADMGKLHHVSRLRQPELMLDFFQGHHHAKAILEKRIDTVFHRCHLLIHNLDGQS